MIAPNTRKQINKRLAQQHAKTLAYAQHNAQKTLNAILWQLIVETAKKGLEEGEEAPDGPAALTIPLSDLKEIPANFALTLHKNDDDSISVLAVLVKPKSNIILPGEG